MGYKLTKVFLAAYCTGREPGPEWLTLLRLAEDAPNDTAICAPGWRELAGGRDRSTVVRHLAVLEREGWIEIAARAAPGRRTRYRVFPEHYQPASERDAPVRHDDQSDVMHETGRRDARNGPTWRTLHASRSGSSGSAVRRSPGVARTGSVAGDPGAAQNGHKGWRPVPEDQVKIGTEGDEDDPWGSDEDYPQSSDPVDPPAGDSDPVPCDCASCTSQQLGDDPWADWDDPP